MLRKLVLILIVVLYSGADTPHDNESHKSFKYLEIKTRAEESRRPFNPGFVSALYRARLYAIRNYEITDSLTMTKRDTAAILKDVAGYLPADRSEGPFQVIFLAEKKGRDAGQADTVYQYGLDSPLYVRRENGGEPGIYKIKDGTFLVPLPPVKNITKIILKDRNSKAFESTFR